MHWVVFLCIFLAQNSWALVEPVSLMDAYRTALEQTEGAQIGQSRIKQADARVDQARSLFFPALSFAAGYTKQDTSNLSAAVRSVSAGGNSYTRLTLSQSIYEGGADQAAFNVAKSDQRVQEANLSAIKYNVFVSVARNYYSILSSVWEIRNIRKTKELAKDRVTEIKKRVSIGRARKIDLLATQAQLSVLESQLIAAEGQLATLKANFALITGIGKEVILVQPPEGVKEPAEIETYLTLLEKRPDIASLKMQAEQARYGISQARSGHFPSVNASGNYYLTREGAQKGNAWDFGVYLTLPIFTGGVVNAAVRENAEKEKEAELLLSQLRRQTELEIRTAYNNLKSSTQQIKSLESALASTEESFKEQEKNYRYGQSTNLDVIQALNLFLETKRTLYRTRYQGMTAWAELNAATAQIGQE